MAPLRTRPLRVLLLQLPPLDPAMQAAPANIPLAAGSLAAFARPRLEGETVLDIAPAALASFGGDEALLDYIVRGEYDVVGCTAYLWNVERSLELAEKLKERRRTLVAMGGPEVAAGRALVGRTAADVFVSGEGESAWAALLASLEKGGPAPRFFQAGPPLDLGDLPNPYLAGELGVSAGQTLHLETMRGCAHECAYCYYAKARPALRYFPRALVRDFFSLAAEKNAGEIYLMDPSFEARPRFTEFLRDLAAWNPRRIPLHTELRLESVTDERAALLKEAGFVSVEAGLQTTNPRALRAVRRTWDRDRFLRGAERLREAGIEVRTGVILGLPEDTLGDFSRTLDFVIAHGLESGLEMYPLALLPGSALALAAGEKGIRAMPLPPYWMLESASWTFADWLRAEELVRSKLERSLFEQPRPHFRDQAPGLIAFRRLESAADLAALEGQTARIGNSLTLLLSDAFFRDGRLLARLAEWRTRFLAQGLLQLVVETDRRIDDDEAERASDLFFLPGALLERCHAFDDDAQGRFAVRLFALASDPALVRSMIEAGSFIDPILRFRPGRPAPADWLSADRPLVLIPPELSADELSEMERIYADTPECLLHYGIQGH